MSCRISLNGRIDDPGVKITRNAKSGEQYARFRVSVRRERKRDSRIDNHVVRVNDPHILNEIIIPKARTGILIHVVGILQYQQYRSKDGSNHRRATVHVMPGSGLVEILEGSEGELI